MSMNKSSSIIYIHRCSIILVLYIVTILQVTVDSQQVQPQVNDGNYIVPKTEVDLRHRSNKSAAGRKKLCRSNTDCEGLPNSLCCTTASGFNRCRKRCKVPKSSSPFRSRRGRKKIHRIKPTVKGCHVGGKIYKEGEQLESHGACRTCICTRGNIQCTDGLCNYYKDQKLCHVDNEVYREGQKVKSKDSCNKCVCSKGMVECTERLCPPAKCSYKGRLYDEGYHLVLANGCKRCVCQRKAWNCTSHPCQDFYTGNSVRAVVSSILVVALASCYSLYQALWHS